LLLSAWYEVLYRAGVVGFEGTPIHRLASGKGGLPELLGVVSEPLVSEVLRLVEAADRSPFATLRNATQPVGCLAGPVFDGSRNIGGADADLLVHGTLIDFKCTRDPRVLPLTTILQLLGYAALDYADSHQISSVALYHARAAALVDWPLPQYLALLGSRLDLLDLRARCAQLCRLLCAYRIPVSDKEELKVARVLKKLGVPTPDICRSCASQVVAGGGLGMRRHYCSPQCRQEVRAASMAVLTIPQPRAEPVDLRDLGAGRTRRNR
jgi:hypothetical protein